MDWDECNDKRLVKEIQKDIDLIESLKKSSEKRLKSSFLLDVNDTTASSVVSLCYESMRELLEALAVENCFKIYNHDCYCAFLKEVMKEEEIAILFDKFRKIRNSINYYGKDLSVEEAKSIRKEINESIKRTKKLFK